MGQFTVHRNANRDSLKIAPYLLDVQHPLLSALDSRIVIPLIFWQKYELPIAKLNPICEIEGKRYMIKTQKLAVVAPAQLGANVLDLSERRYEIIAAIDMLISGI
jgi:toxin CcdB